MLKRHNLLSNQKGVAHLLLLVVLLIGVVVGIYLVRSPQIFSPKAAEAPSQIVEVHKLYHQKHNTWYWADNQSEINNLVSNGFEDAGVLFSAFIDGNMEGTVPLFRLTKAHDYYFPASQLFMTVSNVESDFLQVSNNRNPETGVQDNIANTWTLKDAALYVYPPTSAPAGSVPVYRLQYNTPEDKIFHGSRYYSSDQEEIDALMATGKYINEGVAFYSVGN
jgi:hypothetical protein